MTVPNYKDLKPLKDDFRPLTPSSFSRDKPRKNRNFFYIFYDTEAVPNPYKLDERGNPTFQLVRLDYVIVLVNWKEQSSIAVVAEGSGKTNQCLWEAIANLVHNPDTLRKYGLKPNKKTKEKIIQKGLCDSENRDWTPWSRLEIQVFAHHQNFDCCLNSVVNMDNQERWGYRLSDGGICDQPGIGGQAPFFRAVDFPTKPLEDAELPLRQVIFNDTLNFFRMPLADMGKSVGITKPDLPELTYDEWVADPDLVFDQMGERCKMDVEILWKTFVKWGCWLATNFNTYPRISLARAAIAAACNGEHLSFPHENEIKHAPQRNSLGHSLFLDTKSEKQKNRYFPIAPHQYPEAMEALKKGFKGGMTASFYRGIASEFERIYKYDVRSMYPSEMFKNPVPIVCVGVYKDPKIIQDIIYRSQGDPNLNYKVKVDFYVPPENHLYGLISTMVQFDELRCNDRLCRPTGYISGEFLWREEFDYVKQREGVKVKHPTELHVYLCGHVFSDHISRLDELRHQWPKETHYLENMGCKMLMNSLFGKTGEKARGQWGLVPSQEVSEDGDYRKDRYGRWQLFMPPQQYFAPKAVPQIADFITSMARLDNTKFFYKMLEEHDIQLLYTDTDSGYFNKPLPTEFIGDKLGCWEPEGSGPGHKCYFRCAKDLKDWKEVKRKGAPRHSVQGLGFTDYVTGPFDKFIGKFTTQCNNASKEILVAIEEGATKFQSGINRKRGTWRLPPGKEGSFTEPLFVDCNGHITNRDYKTEREIRAIQDTIREAEERLEHEEWKEEEDSDFLEF